MLGSDNIFSRMAVQSICFNVLYLLLLMDTLFFKNALDSPSLNVVLNDFENLVFI